MFGRTICWLTVFWSLRKTCMIFYSSRNLPGILFNLHLLLHTLVARRLLVLLFIQNRPRWSDFHRILSRHPELCVLFILDYPDSALFSGDIVDHRDIQLLSFFNRGRCQFLINVYSDNLHTAVNFLSREALNIPNLLYMGGDFNIRDTEWDPSVLLHPTAG